MWNAVMWQLAAEFDSYQDKVNTMGTQANPLDDDMPAEIDFSRGTRGKFFKPGAALNLPVYLEAEVQAYLSARARLEELATRSPGEVDLGGHVVVERIGWRSHGVHLVLMAIELSR